MKNFKRTEGTLAFRLFFLILIVLSSNIDRSSACDAHFSHYSGTNPDSLHFYPTGTAATTYLWDFGNGDTSTAQYPWHYFAHQGTYFVCLTVTDSSCTNTWCDSVHVALPPVCNAHFSHYTINNADSAHFYPTSTTATHYFWDFGDGTTSTLSTPWHNFPASGIYTVCLTATNSTSAGTCTDTWCDTTTVGHPPVCNAQFSHYSLHNLDSLHFYPTSTAATHYYWSFSDGFTSNLQTPWHYFTAPGTYYVCLTVYDSTSTGTCTATWCDSVHVGQPPVCNAHFSHYTIHNPDSLHFYPTGSAATHYYWSFSDGTTSNLQYPWHYFTAPGSYYVCLTVYDSTSSGTCSATWCDSVHIGIVPVCNAHFSHYTIHNPDSLHFYPSSTSANHYYWSFSDGFTSNLQTPWHYFAAPGNYYVCLTVTDSTAGGTCSDTWCDSVHIGQTTVCNAHFSHYTLNNPDSIHFYPTGTTGTHYSWNFSDGSTSNLQYPWHYFASSGVYYVCLTIYDSTSAGICSDTWCDSIHVGGMNMICNAHYTYYSIADSIHFISPANPTGTVYTWDFGDGNNSADPNPWYRYASPGIYSACLYVQNFSQNDSWCQQVEFSVFTSIATASEEQVFLLYPNPANTFVTLQMLNVNGANEVALFDVFGRKVYMEKEVRSGTTTIDTQDLKSGLYICVIRNENKVLKQIRLMINH